MDYSLCSYSFNRIVAAGKMDIFGYITFNKDAGFTILDPWMKHIERGYSDNGFLDEVKAAAKSVNLPFGCIAVDGAHIYEPTAEARAENRQRAYRWLEVSHYLGARQVRIDAGGRDIAAEAIFDIVAGDYWPKPHQAIYDQLVRKHDIDPARVAFADDIVVNLKPAHDMGMRTVWIRTDESVKRAVDTDLSHIHHQTDDLATWLEDWLTERNIKK